MSARSWVRMRSLRSAPSWPISRIHHGPVTSAIPTIVTSIASRPSRIALKSALARTSTPPATTNAPPATMRIRPEPLRCRRDQRRAGQHPQPVAFDVGCLPPDQRAAEARQHDRQEQAAQRKGLCGHADREPAR